MNETYNKTINKMHSVVRNEYQKIRLVPNTKLTKEQQQSQVEIRESILKDYIDPEDGVITILAKRDLEILKNLLKN